MSLDISVVNVDQSIVELTDRGPWRADLLHISVHAMEDFTLFVLTGEVCLASVPMLYSHLADITSEVGNALVVDLGLVTFLDASGLSFLIAAHKRLASFGSQLIVFSPSRLVRRLFDVTRLESCFAVVPD